VRELDRGRAAEEAEAAAEATEDEAEPKVELLPPRDSRRSSRFTCFRMASFTSSDWARGSLDSCQRADRDDTFGIICSVS
jgi:hypothetical protein